MLTQFHKNVLFGLGISGILILLFVVYKAIGDYQTGQRIENMDENLAKLAGGKSYSNKLLDKITFKQTSDKIEAKINDHIK